MIESIKIKLYGLKEAIKGFKKFEDELKKLSDNIEKYKKMESGMFKKDDRLTVDLDNFREYECLFIDYDKARNVVFQCFNSSLNMWGVDNVRQNLVKLYKAEIRSFFIWDIQIDGHCYRTDSHLSSRGMNTYGELEGSYFIKSTWKRKVKGSEIKVNMDTLEIVK